MKLAAAVATLCLSLAASGAASPPDARMDIETAIKSYARFLKAQDAEKVAGFYTSDGELLNPGMEVVQGPEAIRKFLASYKDVKVEAAEMLPGTIEIGVDAATQWGSYTQRVVLPGRSRAIEVSGRYVADWRRQKDGKWLIRHMLTQPDPGRPPNQSRP